MVAGWARDFDAEAVFANEKSAVIAHLTSIEDAGPGAAGGAGGSSGRFFQLESVGGAKVDIDAMDVDDEEEEVEDEDMAPAGKRVSTGSASGAAVLYSEEGQFNPHAARADRKKAKKDPAREQTIATARARKQQAEDEEADFEFGEEDKEGEGEGAMSD